MPSYIGLAGYGFDYELVVVHETAKAYLVRTWEEKEVWLPKACFDYNTGELSESGYNLLLSKMEDNN